MTFPCRHLDSAQMLYICVAGWDCDTTHSQTDETSLGCSRVLVRTVVTMLRVDTHERCRLAKIVFLGYCIHRSTTMYIGKESKAEGLIQTVDSKFWLARIMSFHS